MVDVSHHTGARFQLLVQLWCLFTTLAPAQLCCSVQAVGSVGAPWQLCEHFLVNLHPRDGGESTCTSVPAEVLLFLHKAHEDSASFCKQKFD